MPRPSPILKGIDPEILIDHALLMTSGNQSQLAFALGASKQSVKEWRLKSNHLPPFFICTPLFKSLFTALIRATAANATARQHRRAFMNHDQLTPELLPTMLHADQTVITTELMAIFYGAEEENIRQNFRRNQMRFVEGKHFFKLTGDDLKGFRRHVEDVMERNMLVTNCHEHLINPKTSQINLWTERGVARHAKMLNTDQAWEVFEKLEDAYFNRITPQSPVTSNDKLLTVRAAEQLHKTLTCLERKNSKFSIKQVHRNVAIKLCDVMDIEVPNGIKNEQAFNRGFGFQPILPAPRHQDESADWDSDLDDDLDDEEYEEALLIKSQLTRFLMRTRCPHCDDLCTTRKTEQISSLYREITFVCNNNECGHVFVACVSPVRTLSPSAIPDPSVNLPLSAHINKSTLP